MPFLQGFGALRQAEPGTVLRCCAMRRQEEPLAARDVWPDSRDSVYVPGASSQFVGREEELEALLDAARRAFDGRAMTVLVSGEAGVGKTRLTAEAAAYLSSQGWWCPVSHGVFLEGGEVPFGGTAELLRSVARAIGGAEMRRLLGGSAVDLAGLLPALAHDDHRAADRNAVTAAVVTLLERADHPMCWILDDLQWMDGATRDLAAYLAKVTTEGPLLLVGTVRTDPSAPSRLPDALVELARTSRVLTLAPLDREEVAAQVRALADRPLDDEEVARICEVSDGLPFFVEELVAFPGRISGSLQGVLHASLSRLSPGTGTVLAAAAVGEGLLNATSLRAVTNLGVVFDGALAEARNRGVLRVDSQTGRFRFRHALLREAVDATLLGEERLHLHLRWAEHVERALEDCPNDLTLLIERARHRYEAGGREAFPAARAAARAADAADDDRVRMLWWSRSLDLWPAPRGPATALARDRALASCISALWSVGELGMVVERLDVELSAERDWLRTLWLRLSRQLAIRALQESFDPVVPTDHADVTAARLLVAARDFRSTEVMVWLADDWAEDLPDTAFALVEEAHRRLTTRPPRTAVIGAFSLLSMMTIARGEHDRGVQLAEELVTWMSRHDPGGVLDARCSLSLVLCNASRIVEAVSVGEENLRLMRDPILRPHLWTAQHIILGFCSLHTGEWDRTEQCLDLAGQGALGGDIASVRDFAAALLWARRGDTVRAGEYLDRIPDVPSEVGRKRPREAVWRAYAAVELAAVSDSPEHLREVYRRFVAMSRPGDLPEDRLDMCIVSLRAGVARGATGEDSRALVAAASALAGTANGAGAVPAMRAEIEAHVSRASDHDSARAWGAVAQQWIALTRPYDAAYANVFGAECALRDGDREEAERVLVDAHVTARRLGAQPLRKRCEATARRGHLSGVGTSSPAAGLTPREAEVLQYVALGRTNGEVGALLFISPKTVSVHISNILAKLGAANRTEAAAIARNQGIIDV